MINSTSLLLLILLLSLGLIIYLMVSYPRSSLKDSVRSTTLFILAAIAAVANITLAATDGLPEQELSRRPAGALVDIQFGWGRSALVETDRAYYAVSRTLTGRKGERLELRTMKTRLFGKQRVYLCSSQGCSPLVDGDRRSLQ